MPSYVTLNPTEIATGKPVSTTVATKIKDNFDNHEERLESLEGGSAVTYPPIIMRVDGYYADLDGITNVLKTVTNFNLTILGIKLYIDIAGTSDSTEIDILKSSNAGASWTSIFNTKPSISYSAGNDAISSNEVLNSGQVDLSSGDLIRLDVTNTQANGRTFYVRIDYERNA